MIRHKDALNAKRSILLCSSVTHTRNAGLGLKGIFSKECKMKTITASAIWLYVHWTQDFIGVLWSTGVISLPSTEYRGVCREVSSNLVLCSGKILRESRSFGEISHEQWDCAETDFTARNRKQNISTTFTFSLFQQTFILCKTNNLKFKKLSTIFYKTPQFLISF